MTDQRTITVDGSFGEIQITKEKYCEMWKSHTNQLRRINYSLDWQKEVSVMTERVVEVVEADFERLYKEQNK